MTLVALMVPWPIMVVPTYLMKDWNSAVYWAWGRRGLFIISQSFVFWRRFVGAKWKQMSIIGLSAGLARRAGREMRERLSAGLGFLPGICARAIRFA